MMKKTLRFLSFLAITLLTTFQINAQCLPITADVAPPFCEGVEVEFDADCNGGVTWAYDDGVNSGSGSGNTFDLTIPYNSASPDITISVTKNGTTYDSVFMVNMKPVLTTEVNLNQAGWNAGSSAEVCEGFNDIRFRGIFPGNAGYSWTGPNNLNQATRGIILQDVTLAMDGQYEVIYTDANLCKDTVIVDLTVFETPASTATNDGAVCIGESVILDETGGDGTMWSWTGPAGAIFDNASLQSPTVDPALAGVYTVEVTDVNGCTSSASTTVVLNSLPASTATNDGPVCNGESVTLDETGGDGTMWLWTGPVGAVFDDANIQSPTVDPALAGVYTVEVTDVNGCTSSASTTVVLFNDPISNATNNGPVCNGGSVTLDETGGDGTMWSWTGPAGANFNNTSLQSPTVDPALAGVYTVEVTDVNGCTSSSSTTVVLSSMPASTATNDGAVCIGESVILDEIGGDGTMWSWTGPAGANFDNANLQSPTVDPALAGVYTVEVTDGNGCTSSSSTTVVLNSLPASTAINNGPVCIGGSVTLNETGGDGTMWSWTGPAGANFNNTNLESPTVDPALAGVYTVEVTDGNGCTSSASTTVILFNDPLSNATNNGPVCNGESVTLDETAGDGTMWSWTGPAGANFNNTSLESPTVDPALAGVYTVVVTDGNGCTSSSITTVVVRDLPSATISGDVSVCEGDPNQTVVINASGGSGPYIYTYTLNGTSITTPPSGATFNITQSTTTPDTYTFALVEVEDMFGCSQVVSGSVDVLVKPNPTLTIDLKDCASDLLSYFVEFTSNGTVSSSVGNVDNANGIVTDIPPGSNVTLTAILNDCVTSVTVTPPNCECPTDIEEPVNSTPNEDLEICFGDDNSTLTVTTTANNLNANWYIQPTGGVPLNNTPSLSFPIPNSYSAPDTYVFFAETIDEDSDCVSLQRTPISYIIHALPMPEITPDNPFICTNTSVILDAGNYEEYEWNDNSTNQTFNATLQGTYEVTVTDLNGCEGEDDVFVDLHPSPTVSFPTTNIFEEYCSNESAPTLEFILSPGNGNIVSAEYSFNDGAPINGNVVDNVLIINNANPGQYKVVFIEDAECSTEAGFMSSSITVVELDEPVFTIQKTPVNNSLVCEGDDFTLVPSLSGGQYDYDWDTPNGSSNSASLSFTNVDGTFTGTYTLTITDTSSGQMCTSVSSFEVEVSEVDGVLTTDQQNGDTEICLGESINLIAEGVGGDDGVTWLNDIPSDQVNDIVVEVNPSTTTTYNAILQNEQQCTEDASITITVNPLPNPIIASNSTQYCDGDNVVLSTTSNFAEYEWSNGEESATINVGASNLNSDFSVTVTNNNGCINTDDINLTVFETPLVGISTIAQNIQAGEEALFEFKDPETDPACGVQIYNWTITGDGFNVFGDTTDDFFNFTFTENGIYEVCVVLVDDCNNCMSEPSCIIMDIDDNTSCGVSFRPQGNNCTGEESTLVAIPKAGEAVGSNIPELGVFIIESIVIDENHPLDVVFTGDNGLDFEIKEKWSTDEPEFLDSIIVIFHDPGQYNFSFDLDYGNCEKTVGPIAAIVQDVPDFSNIMIDNEACFGELARVDFIVPSESEDFQLSYTINDGAAITKNFSGESDEILFSPSSAPPSSINIELLSLTNLIGNEPTGCFSDEISPDEFTINFLEEVGYFVQDSCNEDLTEVQYTITIEGGTGDYSLNGSDVDGNEFVTPFFESGQSQVLSLVDEGCDEENSQSVPLASSCETCVPLDELVVEQGIIVDGDQNVCENDDVIFTMDKAPEIAPNQVIVYTVQRVPTQFYDENEVIIDSIPSDPTNFTFNINSSSVFVVGEDYYISAFVFSEVQTGFKPDENCKGILARTLTFYETPEAEITNLEDDTNICINEFDYQIGLSNTVTSSAFSSSDPEVSIFYIEGDTRALINAGAVTSDELVITLTQTINHTTTDGVLECSDMTDLTLNVLDKVSPSKDTIISFPGNMYTFVSDGFCYQWGLNDDLLTGETDRFYIADGALSEGDVLWINVWDCADDALECVSTIYYNVLEPPKTEINPEKELVYNLYPNPNEGIFNLELDGPQGGQFNAYLYDATGKLVQSISFIKDEIIHNQVIGFQDSSPGLYLLQVLGENGEKQLIKIIKH